MQRTHEITTEEIDIRKLRYVLYARKSTDDPQRQIRSIDDQIAECRELARRKGIRILDVITEKKSAKKPGKRPLFRQMLNDLKKGKYDGIVSWNPDRLARNMKEGGEIIDMIDDEIIKDLQFVNHHFSRDANGKMLLGMAFVLSKQYSDNLSQNVTRGVRRQLSEGKALNSKHGYIRDESGLQKSDGKNFELICEAWQMRLEGISLEEIAKYMNDSGYRKIVKSSGKLVKMDKRMLSDIFKDPFYYGILIQANQEVDLRTIYDFQPAITEREYIDVQRLTDKRIKPYKQKRTVYYPLKQIIFCSFCGNHMYAGASRSHTGKRLLYYRCDSDLCSRRKKSIRGKIIFNFIYKFLSEGLHFTEKDYDKYYTNITSLNYEKREKLQFEIHSKQGLLRGAKAQVNDIAYKILDEKNIIVKEINEKRLTEIQESVVVLEAEIEQLKQQITDPQTEKLSVEQFLNLSKNAAKIIKSGDVIVKDVISRSIFLNLSVDEEKVASWQLKPPFDEMLKTHSVSFSRGERT